MITWRLGTCAGPRNLPLSRHLSGHLPWEHSFEVLVPFFLLVLVHSYVFGTWTQFSGRSDRQS
jgi:hypothetical protein